ncbi:MAG: hypothetical protein QW814_02460 [Methanothrix sp.]
MANKDKNANIEYITLNVPRISFVDLKPYLTKEVVPKAIRAYAEICAKEDSRHENASGNILYDICLLSQKTIDNSLKLFNEAISDYKVKHGYSDSCESMENTIRMWENAKIKMLDEKYFEEVIVDSLNNIKSGKTNIDMEKIEPSVKNAMDRILVEVRFELNNTHFLPKTDLLGRLLRGGKK